MELEQRKKLRTSTIMTDLKLNQRVQIVDPNSSFLEEWKVVALTKHGPVLRREEEVQFKYDGEKYLEADKPLWVARWVNE